MINDIRYALRMLAKNPAFACVVVLTLALGTGANAAIFSLLDRVLLQSLPVANPDQLAVLSTYDPKDGPDTDSSFSFPMSLTAIEPNESAASLSVETFSRCSVCVPGPEGFSRRKTTSHPARTRLLF